MPQDIIAHGPGMVFHIINLVVMVLMPMVVIHVKDAGFSLGKRHFTCRFRFRDFRDDAIRHPPSATIITYVHDARCTMHEIDPTMVYRA